MAKKTLPKEIEKYLQGSILFSRFGIVNLNVVKALTKEPLKFDELEKLINDKFAKEMTKGKIEFIRSE